MRVEESVLVALQSGVTFNRSNGFRNDYRRPPLPLIFVRNASMWPSHSDGSRHRTWNTAAIQLVQIGQISENRRLLHSASSGNHRRVSRKVTQHAICPRWDSQYGGYSNTQWQ